VCSTRLRRRRCKARDVVAEKDLRTPTEKLWRRSWILHYVVISGGATRIACIRSPRYRARRLHTQPPARRAGRAAYFVCTTAASRAGGGLIALVAG
jgi:hypothetical protein